MIDRREYQAVELLVLFILMPLLYLFDLIPVHKFIPLLLLFLYCIFVLGIHKRLKQINWKLQAHWKHIGTRFAGVTLVVFLFILLTSHPLLADLQAQKRLLLMIIIYPFLSAFPQELIFREFFFFRYTTLFKNQKSLLVSNVLLFSFAHIFFYNWIILVFTLVAGSIFASTYLKTKSLLVVTLEHTVYGLMILFSGLAGYFYKEF
ncbi:MAG TPA: CPBP family intramembrane glutamic endopeptidase [Cytophagaceae bacterium]|nr:CPBP family intramembrane glutamic endopeptidase [Cytophagaceae bacterium]